MRLVELSTDDTKFRQSLIKGLKLLLAEVPTGSRWLVNRYPYLADDDIRIILRWINALESFMPNSSQNELDLGFVTKTSNELYKILKAKNAGK